ncbi:MAG: LacI family DNA-binding transcriptional regulator [Bacteroidia bacterium]|nr:LacI family DNA-binding transcriptional regulator [Bacteroidia bacterium]
MKGKDFATIKDIAQALGISPSTVSRALRDLPDVNPATRHKVLEMARDIHYQRNHFAAGLVSNRSYLIGVVVPQIANYFFSTVISGIQEIAWQHQYRVIICESKHEPAREELDLQALVSMRVDGILIAPLQEREGPEDAAYIRRLIEQETPVVCFDRQRDELMCPVVLMDDYKAAFDATAYLIKTGCRRIGHLGADPVLQVARLRRAGYEAALRQYGLPVREAWIRQTGFKAETARRDANSLMSGAERPDALLCINDLVAIGATSEIKSMGLRVPDDVSIIGFYDSPVASLMDPPLTMVHQPALEMGHAAMNLLLSEMKAAARPHEAWQDIKQGHLVIRHSTRPEVMAYAAG